MWLLELSPLLLESSSPFWGAPFILPAKDWEESDMFIPEIMAAEDGAPEAYKFSFIYFWVYFDGIGVFWFV